MNFMDRLTPEQRHKNMSRIRNKDSKIELTLRKALWQKGFRYRKNYKQLPGIPDIVLTKYKIAIFCDSEFWHGDNWNELKEQLKKNRNADKWIRKISRNIERDREVNAQLNAMGWTVMRFWGKDILKRTEQCVKAIEEQVFEIKIGTY